MYHQSPSPTAGFTLVELITVIAVMGLLGTYVAMKNSSPSVFTLSSQAQTLASDIRHVQTLATTWGKSLRITAVTGVNGSYSVRCLTAGASPCNSLSAIPVLNPATGSAFIVTLKKNVDLSGPVTLDINSQGQPSAAASYMLTSGSASKTVDIKAITGYVTVSP